MIYMDFKTLSSRLKKTTPPQRALPDKRSGHRAGGRGDEFDVVPDDAVPVNRMDEELLEGQFVPPKRPKGRLRPNSPTSRKLHYRYAVTFHGVDPPCWIVYSIVGPAPAPGWSSH